MLTRMVLAAIIIILPARLLSLRLGEVVLRGEVVLSLALVCIFAEAVWETLRAEREGRAKAVVRCHAIVAVAPGFLLLYTLMKA